MIRWLFRRQLDRFERKWGYDASYLRDLLAADPRALMAFGKAAAIGRYRKDIPRTAHYAAGIVAVMAEDCGPCAQLGIDKAESEGIDPAILRAIVARDFAAMPDDVALAVRFTEASLRRAPEAEELRAAVVRRWGERGLISLCFAMVASRLYPTLKYALGHGKSCTRLRIGGETRAVLREATKAA